jgi:cysteine-rich repeat protein
MIERCGNSVVEGTEECDDGNSVAGDGCEEDCTFSCVDATDCDDGLVCNGDETCNASNACEAGTPPPDATDCGGGMVCRSGTCAMPVCGNSIVEGTEQCDDGDSTEGDGCDNDCTFSCAMDAECNDGESCNGIETCNTTTHQCTNPPNLANGTDCGGGNVCNGGACVAPNCGNTIVEGTEQCDDGNATNGDGCDNDCTFSCTTAADCSDGNLCNGAESCTLATHTCTAGTAAANGTVCDRDGMPGTRDICRSGTCSASRCGDMFVDDMMGGTEDCDDGNGVNGDGCDNDCSFSCTTAADCSDGLLCNGSETCTLATHTCAMGTPAADGTTCDRGMMTRDLCLMGTCARSRCGDGYLDMGATPAEECDDGNLTAGDGCEPDCTIGAPPPTAFRVTSLDLMHPHFFISLFGCRDVTDSPFLGFSVNGALQDSVDDYTLNYIAVHRPLDIAATTNPVDLVDGECVTPGPSCSVGAGTVFSFTGTNRPFGMTCFTPDPTRYDYSAPNTVTGPCFLTDQQSIVVSVSGTPIPLIDSRVAATYTGGSPPNRLVSGVITGFLTRTAAMAAILPSSLPLVGGDSLYEHLAHARASGSSCSSNDDSVMYAPSGGGGAVVGFWFFLNFTADQVTWTDP